MEAFHRRHATSAAPDLAGGVPVRNALASNGSLGRLPSPPGTSSLALDKSLERATNWVLDRQAAEGFWCGILEGDLSLESEFVLLQAYLNKLHHPRVEAAARAIEKNQNADGGWSSVPGGYIDISTSVKAYFALKLCGRSPDAPLMFRARRAIHNAGGADCVNSLTRFHLALLGQLDYKFCPAVPPEAILLPNWFPIHLYKLSAWARTLMVPLALVWASRPVRKIPSHCGIEELYLRSPDRWPMLLSARPMPKQRFLAWESFFRGADRLVKMLEDRHVRPLRRLATKRAERWMLDHFVDSDGLGAIFPSIVWSRIALDCLGYPEASAEVRYCDEQLDVLIYRQQGSDHLRIQPCESPVWDTTLVVRALDAAGVSPEDPHLTAAVDWLLEKQVTRPGDWSKRTKKNVEPGGWFFEFHNEFYPDVDDTVMALMALRTQLGDCAAIQSLRFDCMESALQTVERQERIRAAADRALTWILAMQNRDGGWGAFDRNSNTQLLRAMPLADHVDMIDPSSPDMCGRVLEALAAWDTPPTHPAVTRAIKYLRRTQEADGSWLGRWGVNSIYGTWQALVGLRAVGIEASDACVARGIYWLKAKQQPSGGWGETALSYEQSSLRGSGPATASQTAWAILGLLATCGPADEAVQRGVEYLLSTQTNDGSWEEAEFTGTGFARSSYWRYHMAPHYFPMLALGQYHAAARQANAPQAKAKPRTIRPRILREPDVIVDGILRVGHSSVRTGLSDFHKRGAKP